MVDVCRRDNQNLFIMKSKIKALTIFLTVSLIAASCSKYEEGPALTLRGKKTRVVNTWKVDYAKDIGDDVETTSDYAGETFTFEKNGDYLENGDLEGTWDFDSNKEFIVVTETDGSVDRYMILRLKENDLRVQIEDDEIIHLIPA